MLYQLKRIESRAANAENPQGKKSRGGLAGGGRKGCPCIEDFHCGQTLTLFDAEGPGVVRHIWMTFPPNLTYAMRNIIIRMYWNGQEYPSVEAPVGDFFGIAHGRRVDLCNELFSVQNGKGLNCWAPMPFGHARITLTNDGDEHVPLLFYQIDYSLGDALDDDVAYFHAQFRRSNPTVLHEDYVILDNVSGRGHVLGTVIGVRDMSPNLGWWGEGEVKFYIDGERQPTICGTGIEDYIGFAWGLSHGLTSTQGCVLCNGKLGLYSLYRLHTKDPIVFNNGIRITVQQIGYGSGKLAATHFGDEFRRYRAFGGKEDDDMCYFDRIDDYCSVAYWYQTLPSVPFPPLPGREARCADLMLDNDGGHIRRDDI